MATPVTPAPARPPYKAPEAPQGIVLWSTNPGSGLWFPAVVTARGTNGSVSLLVFPEDSRTGTPRDSVLHATDPQFAQRLDQSQGVWDYTPETKLLHKLAESLRSPK